MLDSFVICSVWDVRPFAPTNRCMKVFNGHSHGFEKYLIKCCWSKDGRKVLSGSSDRFVYIWDSQTRQILYRLPGHDGTVVAVDMHPAEPICKETISHSSSILFSYSGILVIDSNLM